MELFALGLIAFVTLSIIYIISHSAGQFLFTIFVVTVMICLWGLIVLIINGPLMHSKKKAMQRWMERKIVESLFGR